MTTKTNDQMIGEMTREIDQLKSLIAAHNEPIKTKIKAKEESIKRLLLEDGRQTVDMTLIGDE